MKNKISILLIALSFGFLGCNNSVESKKTDPITTALVDTTQLNVAEVKEVIEVKDTFHSSLRPNAPILLNKTYTDTIEFATYNDDGDYALLMGKKNNKEVVLIYNTDWRDNEKYNFKYGDLLKVNWNMDSIYLAGEGEALDYKETAIDVTRIVSKSKAIKFLWRAAEDDVVLDQKYNDIVINQSFCNSISNQEKAALAFVATFIGNACMWDGKVNEDRSNLKCKILTALNLGYQCSDAHLGFLKHWFSQDEEALKKLEVCVTMPETATVQSTFDEITIETNADQHTITVTYKVIGVNMRESKSWHYTKTDHFAFTCESIDLINSQKSEITYND